MEPQIRYARRTDGARTAYAAIGSGQVMIYTPGFTSHLEWNFGLHAGTAAFRDTLAARRTLIYYDRHGCGLSDRRRTDFTPEDDMLDIYAVVEASGAAQVDLFGLSFGGMVAVRYVLEHPERVRRLILWGTTASMDRSTFPPDMEERMSALTALRRTDPELSTRIFASQVFPSGVDPETFQFMVRANKESATADMLEQLETVAFDNREHLASVSVPTLVLHRRGDQVVPFAAGQYLARRLPNARFVPLDGDCHLPNFGDVDSVLEPILKFLAEDDIASDPAAPAQDAPTGTATAVILFTDIVSSTELTERMGDAAFRDASRHLDAGLRTAIRDAGGAAVDGKLLGDGVLATFPSAAQAIDGARRCLALSAASELGLHIGLHAGDVIREEGNVFGGAVNIASRICGLSAPGEILVSDVVRGMARSSAGVVFEDRGESEMKGVGEPVRVYAVGSQQ